MYRMSGLLIFSMGGARTYNRIGFDSFFEQIRGTRKLFTLDRHAPMIFLCGRPETAGCGLHS